MEISEDSPRTVRYIIFIAVAVLIVSAIAVPVIASTGTYTKTYTNEGARYSSVLDDYATEIANGYNEIAFNSEGIYLTKSLDPDAEPIALLTVAEYVPGFPLYVMKGADDRMWVLEYNGNGTYTNYEALMNIVTEGSAGSLNYSLFCFIQNPNGDRIMTTDGIYYTSISDVFGVGYYYTNESRTTIFCEGMKTWWSYGGGNFGTEGETVLVSEDVPDGYYAESMSYEDIYCMYYIGYPFSSEESATIFDNMPYLGALISAIPLIIIAGIILMIVKNKAETE